MSIRLSEDEAWEAVAASQVGILTTLRSDGQPIALPSWFIVADRTICISTPPGSKKVKRVRRDPRASFLIESGIAWRSLTAVHMTGTVSEVTDQHERAALKAAMDEKYKELRVPRESMPARTQAHYAESAILRFVPDGRMLTWDNRRIRLSGS